MTQDHHIDRVNPPGGISNGSSTDRTPLAYFDSLRSAYQAAGASAGGIEEKNYCVAGFRLCFRFAGPALVAPLAAALSHLECAPSAPPDLTVLVWDSNSTNTASPRPGWEVADHREWGEIRGFCNERFYTVYQILATCLTMVDVERATALCWVRSAEHVPLSERGAPFRVLLNFWLARHGLIMLHSGAIGLHWGGVLLAGAGGAGKSSTALACLGAGLRYAADDYCLVSSAAPATAYSLYNSAKLYPQDRAVLSLPAEPALWYQDATSDKALVFLQQAHPDKIASSLPIAAVLLPRIAHGRDTFLHPVSGKTALRTLTLGTMALPPSRLQDGLAQLANLVRNVPCFGLHLGTDRTQIPRVITELLQPKDRAFTPSRM